MPSELYGGLASILGEGAQLVRRWTDGTSWSWEEGSPASAEVANTEVRANGSPWADRPVRTVYQFAQMAVQYTAEMATSVALLMLTERPTPPSEVLVRSSLEAASVAWWLFEPGLSARQRVCRMQLLRRNSARELGRSIVEVGADPSWAASETVANIDAECTALGIASFGDGGNALEGERRLGYTARVKQLTDDFGFTGGYSIYSAPAHAELAGLWRLFRHTSSSVSDRSPQYTAQPDPRTAEVATNGALVAMIAPMERVAKQFGWTVPGRGQELSDAIDAINAEMDRLKALVG